MNTGVSYMHVGREFSKRNAHAHIYIFIHRSIKSDCLWKGRGNFSSALWRLYVQLYFALTSHDTQMNWSQINKEQAFKRKV